MKKDFFIVGFICAILVSVLSCVSTERPFTEVYTGETEQMLLNTRWELLDTKSIDNFTLIVEFGSEGAVIWYNIPDSYNSMLSEKSTWKRVGNNVVFNSKNGFYFYEGEINITGENATIEGKYKTGYKRPLKSNPVGNFIMTKQ